jgi:flagellar FliJ protein
MARFVFRLDPVLAHRQRLEDEQQIVFAAALKRVVDAEAIRDRYIASRDDLRARLQGAHGDMDADELRATYAHCEYLDRAIIVQERVIEDVARLAAVERAALQERTRDKKILETLKGRRRETFDLAAALAEQRENDEINARRFDRATLSGETSS